MCETWTRLPLSDIADIDCMDLQVLCWVEKGSFLFWCFCVFSIALLYYFIIQK